MRVDMILTRGKVGVPGRSYLLLLHNSDEDACVRTASAPHSNSTLATVPRTPSAAMIIPPRVSGACPDCNRSDRKRVLQRSLGPNSARCVRDEDDFSARRIKVRGSMAGYMPVRGQVELDKGGKREGKGTTCTHMLRRTTER